MSTTLFLLGVAALVGANLAARIMVSQAQTGGLPALPWDN